jgi:hypothetical protein
MTQKIKEWVRMNEWVVVAFFVLFFISIRLAGVHLPLHQDEYKWPAIVSPASEENFVPHPPLGEFIYKTAGYIVGFDTDFRFVPLFFGTINLLLLYYFIRNFFGKREALIAGLIWSLSYFSVLASLMVDTDGEILPFFFLLSLISYFKLTKSSSDNKKLWVSLVVISLTLGLMVKLSFVLVVGAIALDFLWTRKDVLTKKDTSKYFGFTIVAIGCLGLLLTLAKFVFPSFDLSRSLVYWEHFFTLDRGWFQTAIQCIKAILYSSPFLILIPFFSNKEDLKKTRVFLFFLALSFVFYIVLFDFSLGALDRYLQLLVLPLTVISTVVISDILKEENRRDKEFLLIGSILALVLIFLQSLPHYVPPLHPKTEWVGRFIHIKWNFVYPFSGGSGPLGFYVSFLFIALAWIISIIALTIGFFKSKYRRFALLVIIPISFVYNTVFIEEYFFGFWNGHAPGLLRNAVTYIKNNPEIKMVTVYNDNGGNEIKEIGKYRKRLYVDPKFDINEKVATLNQYKEHYFVLDVPNVDPASVYAKYFNSCNVVYKETDKKMSATIYDCRGVPDLKI